MTPTELDKETKEKLLDIGCDVYWHIFHLLDAEPSLDGNECGEIAHLAELLVKESLTKKWQHNGPFG